VRHWVQVWEKLAVPLEDRKEWALLFVGRGASDVDANSSFYKMGRLLSEAMGVGQFIPAFIGITWPSVDEALQLLLRQRPKGVIMVPYFLFTGVLVQRLATKIKEFQERSPWIKIHGLQPFGPDPVLCEVMEDRIEEARGSKQLALPCVTCSYRVPLGVLQERVGGLKSLLWSLRHQLTHQQSMPHQHAHAPLEKHVLVCTNTDCAAKGAVPLALALQSTLRKAGKHKTIKVTRTSCLGRCGEGPTVAVYPDGVWYRQMNKESAERLVDEHLLNDRLLGDHVDHVLA
jgi:(2Fe-2S) ferredoxin/sirohydrochlorin ferrochelatase